MRGINKIRGHEWEGSNGLGSLGEKLRELRMTWLTEAMIGIGRNLRHH